MPGPRLAHRPFTLLVLISTPSPLAISSGMNVPGDVVHAPPIDRERSLPLLTAAADEAGAAADAGVAEHEVDVIGTVPAQQLVPELPNLRLVGHVAAMAGDEGVVGGAGLRRRGGRCDSLGVPVARGHRASLRRQLADELATHTRAATGDYRELAREHVFRGFHLPKPPTRMISR